MDGNGHNPLNGNSLASLAGARLRVEEKLNFESTSLADAMSQIRKLRGTGVMTIPFQHGKPSGVVEWRTTRKIPLPPET